MFDVTNTNIIVVNNNANGSLVRTVGMFDVSFASGASWASSAFIGLGNATIAPQPPSFDDAFWSTNNGNIYAPGAPSTGAGTYLIRVPYNGTAVSAAAGYAQIESHRHDAADVRRRARSPSS